MTYTVSPNYVPPITEQDALPGTAKPQAFPARHLFYQQEIALWPEQGPNVAALRNWFPIPGSTNLTCITQGRTTPGDGDGALYLWNPTDQRPDDGATVINPTGNTGVGRWNSFSLLSHLSSNLVVTDGTNVVSAVTEILVESGMAVTGAGTEAIIQLPVGTTGQKGILQADGATIDVVSGIISVPTATGSALGLVQPDESTITVNSGGVITAALPGKATSSSFGIVEPDNTSIVVNGGVLSVPIATSATLGLARPDDTTMTVSSGVLSVPKATSSSFGIVEPDDLSIVVSGGVISTKVPAVFKAIAQWSDPAATPSAIPANEVLLRCVPDIACVFSSGASLCVGVCGTPATSATVFNLGSAANGTGTVTNFGNFTVASGGIAVTTAISATVSFTGSSGVLTVTAPATPDATCSNVGFTVKAKAT